MIPRFRPVFAKLSRNEIQTVWYHLCKYRGFRPTSAPWFNGEKMYDDLDSAGVYQAEVAAGLISEVNHRALLRKILGEQV